ncbi:MAG: hypothetical protein AAGA15_15705 [Pseudomonadota bacterium]
MASIALVGLAACDPAVPDSGAGVGFGSAEEFRAAQAARDAELRGTPAPDQTAGAVDAVIPGPEVEPTIVLETDVVSAISVETAPAGEPGTERSGEISDEQNFDAVAGRESIESDAARIASNRQQYVVIQPTALPSRAGAGPNIVAYALATNNPVGVQLYRRSGLSSQNRFLRNCADYASADLAQQAFLANGGPERDRRGLDPDGDGFACAWDPTPFRAVAN